MLYTRASCAYAPAHDVSRRTAASRSAIASLVSSMFSPPDFTFPRMYRSYAATGLGVPPAATAGWRFARSLSDAGDFSNEAVAMLRHRLDIGAFTAAVAKGTPNGVDRLADIPVLDEDARPHRRQDPFPRDERAAVSDEMNERPERLLGDDDAFAARTALERALADIELELAELIDLA